MPRINIPPITRILLVLLVAFTLLYNAVRYRQAALAQTPDGEGQQQPTTTWQNKLVPYLTIVPQFSLYYPWVFVSAALVERNIFTLAFSALAIYYGGRYLERAWGSKEFIKFLLIVSFVPNLLTTVTYLFFFALTRNEYWGLSPIFSPLPLVASFLVAFKQLVPEHTVTIFRGILKFRIKHFPFLFQLTNLILSIIFTTPTPICLSAISFLVSFTHLRFFALQPLTLPSASGETSTALRGDPSSTFAFPTFFPSVIQAPVTVISDTIYTILLTLHLCTPFSAADIENGNAQASARDEVGLPYLLNNGRGGRAGMGKREEAERRRALALKALDQRLHAAQAARAAREAANSAAAAPEQKNENSSS
ncbi:MAG: hypothetical protein M1834_003094 [Cirrosporium novae-zelandiae]|nr:MAG: hypothetical protein M1834_003094 [Cirrosporium novae-zelandiae]